MANRKKKDNKKPRVHKDLEGFEISINNFGEIQSNMDIEKINKFLNKTVDDKKLRDRNDIDKDEKGEDS